MLARSLSMSSHLKPDLRISIILFRFLRDFVNNRASSISNYSIDSKNDNNNNYESYSNHLFILAYVYSLD